MEVFLFFGGARKPVPVAVRAFVRDSAWQTRRLARAPRCAARCATPRRGCCCFWKFGVDSFFQLILYEARKIYYFLLLLLLLLLLLMI